MTLSVRRLDPDAVRAAAMELGALFVDAVDDNASIGFMAGLALDDAAAWWRALAARPDGRVVFAADDAAGVAGAVVLVPMRGAFQPHRAEIAKLVVHRRARGQGLAAALMAAAEGEARRQARTVLTLMTRHGSDGDRLYRRLGWALVGVIERDSLAPDGSAADASIYRKALGGSP